MPDKIALSTRSLTASFSGKTAVRDISLDFDDHTVTAIIGPSGCGKSTFLRCLNRMHELTPGGTVTGSVMLDGEDIYSASSEPVELRKKVGMVFQKPTPFPTMSIYKNVAAGLLVADKKPDPSRETEIVEKALRGAGLWDEVGDRLKSSAMSLSGGQQQRLCIARAIAPEPKVLLLDEPTSALDPISTQRIEELVHVLKKDFTVIAVTHNMQQASRISDTTAFFYMGDLIEAGPTDLLFTNPSNSRTEDYITGRFG